MARLKPGEKRVYLSFQRDDDLKLYAFIEKEAYRCRWDLETFILASLQEAFKDRIDEEDVAAIAEEAAKRVRERTVQPLVDIPVPAKPAEPAAPKPPSVSMEQAAKEAEAQIAQLNPPGMKLKRGKIPVPVTK